MKITDASMPFDANSLEKVEVLLNYIGLTLSTICTCVIENQYDDENSIWLTIPYTKHELNNRTGQRESLLMTPTHKPAMYADEPLFQFYSSYAEHAKHQLIKLDEISWYRIKGKLIPDIFHIFIVHLVVYDEMSLTGHFIVTPPIPRASLSGMAFMMPSEIDVDGKHHVTENWLRIEAKHYLNINDIDSRIAELRMEPQNQS